MEVFWRQGYEATTIADLTSAMGIGPPSLYAAFGSKESLFREAVALYDSLEGSDTELALREEATARGAMEAMLRGNADNYTDPDKPSGCLIVLGLTNWNRENEAVGAYLSELRELTQTSIRKRLERGINDGDVSPEVDTDALATYFNTLLEGLSIQARDGASREKLHSVIDCALAGWESLSFGTYASSRPPSDPDHPDRTHLDPGRAGRDRP